MMFIALLFWAALIALAVWGAGRLLPSLGQREAPSRSVTPLDILAQRYARGEIGGEEYQTIRNDLRGTHERGAP
jgi:uncharacterized membrane protein